MATTPVALGNGNYAGRFVRRATLLGPARPMGEVPNLGAGTWGRRQQTTTDANCTVNLGAEGCTDVLANIEPWRDELELYRENGMSDDLVWAGPVQNVVANPDQGTATVTAKDMSAWWSKRVLTRTFVHKDTDLATIFTAYLTWAFALDDPGIDVVTTPTGILGDRTVAAADLRKLGDELAELARTGVDWTVAGRQFWVGGQELDGRTTTLPTRLVDEAFASPPQTRRTGEGMATETFVRGNNVQGHAGGPDAQDGVLLQEVRDDQSIEDKRSADAAATSWLARVGEALIYVEGDNALDPSAPIDIQTLIPGVLVPVDLGGGGVVPYRGTLRLESLTGTFDAEGEQLTVALQPAGEMVEDS